MKTDKTLAVIIKRFTSLDLSLSVVRDDGYGYLGIRMTGVVCRTSNL